jgi:copper resistance protein D
VYQLSVYVHVLSAIVWIGGMLALSVVHDFWLGPAATRATDGARLRRPAALLARVNGLLALLVVFLAVALVRGPPW